VSLRPKLFAVMAIPAIVLLVATTFGYRATVRQRESADLVRLTYEIRSRIDQVVRDLSAAESSVRGYLVADDPALLWPYENALATIDRPLGDLERLVVDPQAQALVQQLDGLVRDRIARLQELRGFAPLDAEELGTIGEVMAEGSAVMGEARSVAGELGRLEDGLLAERAAALEDAQRTSFLIQVVVIPIGMLLVGVVVLTFTRRLLRRIDSLFENIGRLEHGMPLLESPMTARDELGMLERTFTETGTRVMELRSQLERIATVDALTGLQNRHGFLPLAEERLVAASATGSLLAMLFIDLDGLKHVNDTQGHAVGDELIAECGSIIRDTFRAADIMARVGGDEFCVLVTTDSQGGLDAAQDRLRRGFELANRLPGRTYELSASVGIAVHDPNLDRSIDDLIRRADTEMYENKRARRTLEATAGL
jgi:diguanylate cyclase (GGDEF)-like protein